MWPVIALLVAWRFWRLLLESYFLDNSFNRPPIMQLVSDSDIDILAAVIVSLFPFLYQLVFGMLPLEHLRVIRATFAGGQQKEGEATISEDNQEGPISVGIVFDPNMASDSNPEQVLAALVKSSTTLSRRIFARAGIYLILGVIIAFGGLLLFYLQTIGESVGPAEWHVELIRHAPRFGILFFLEFIAMFFLRQYRADMEEFRYFEGIQRKREELFALVRFMKSKDGNVDTEKLLETDSYFSSPRRLAPGESTELLEAKRLTKDEAEVIIKFMEVLAQFRKN